MEPTNQPELSFEEGLKDVVLALPVPIRNYLREKKYEPIVARLTEKYKLHVDQGGVLEREIVLLLMGVKNPSEFAATLQSDGQVPQAITGQIMNDINEQVFTRLQQEMRAQGSGTPKAPEQKPPVPITPAIAKVAPIPVNLPGAPVNLLADHEETHINLTPKPVTPPVPKPMPVPQSTPVQIPPNSVAPRPAPAPQPPRNAGTDPYREPIDEK